MINEMTRQENIHKSNSNNIDDHVSLPNDHLWTDVLICAFEFVRAAGCKKLVQSSTTEQFSTNKEDQNVESGVNVMLGEKDCYFQGGKCNPRRICWVPIGWTRISQLVQTVQVDDVWALQATDSDEEDCVAVAEVTVPYQKRPVGPIWWCHVAAGHPFIHSWLSSTQWLHPAISIALRDESRLISERMKPLFYEVPVRVAGGLLFEVLGQSVGDPLLEEDDVPAVLRSWQEQSPLVTACTSKAPHQILMWNFLLLEAPAYSIPYMR